MRGTGGSRGQRSGETRFIPARAGNGLPPPALATPTPVHPRTCGERRLWLLVLRGSTGSSPHVRGTGLGELAILARERFIPARAGNGLTYRLTILLTAVHPRTCGERVFSIVCALLQVGSSPHVRGTVERVDCRVVTLRFIPARAGNGRRNISQCTAPPVHPRTCGERVAVYSSEEIVHGSSPHVRGTGWWGRGRDRERRFIPARAGNGTSSTRSTSSFAVHPRTCGERLERVRAHEPRFGSSPHVRGTGGQRVRGRL